MGVAVFPLRNRQRAPSGPYPGGACRLWREGRGEHATPRRMCRGVECPPATSGNPTSAFSPRAAGLVSQALEGADGEVIGSPVVSDSGRANPLLRLFEERKARRTFAREHIRSDIIAV